MWSFFMISKVLNQYYNASLDLYVLFQSKFYLTSRLSPEINCLDVIHLFELNSLKKTWLNPDKACLPMMVKRIFDESSVHFSSKSSVVLSLIQCKLCWSAEFDLGMYIKMNPLIEYLFRVNLFRSNHRLVWKMWPRLLHQIARSQSCLRV